MQVKLRTQRSRPRRLNGVAPKNRIGTSLVRKKWRTSEMFFSFLRGCPVGEANAASVPTLISFGLADEAGVRLAVPDFNPTDLVLGRFAAGAASWGLASAALLVRLAAPDFRPTDFGLGRFAAGLAFLAVVL